MFIEQFVSKNGGDKRWGQTCNCFASLAPYAVGRCTAKGDVHHEGHEEHEGGRVKGLCPHAVRAVGGALFGKDIFGNRACLFLLVYGSVSGLQGVDPLNKDAMILADYSGIVSCRKSVVFLG